eukprot:3668627-Amphidinium_carterae.1
MSETNGSKPRSTTSDQATQLKNETHNSTCNKHPHKSNRKSTHRLLHLRMSEKPGVDECERTDQTPLEELSRVHSSRWLFSFSSTGGLVCLQSLNITCMGQ